MTSPDADDRPVLRVVIYREAHYWLAQGLEHDVGAQAERLSDLVGRLGVALRAEIDRGAFETLPPAPPYFQALWPARAAILVLEDHTRLCAPGGPRVVLGMVA